MSNEKTFSQIFVWLLESVQRKHWLGGKLSHWFHRQFGATNSTRRTKIEALQSELSTLLMSSSQDLVELPSENAQNFDEPVFSQQNSNNSDSVTEIDKESGALSSSSSKNKEEESNAQYNQPPESIEDKKSIPENIPIVLSISSSSKDLIRESILEEDSIFVKKSFQIDSNNNNQLNDISVVNSEDANQISSFSSEKIQILELPNQDDEKSSNFSTDSGVVLSQDQCYSPVLLEDDEMKEERKLFNSNLFETVSVLSSASVQDFSTNQNPATIPIQVISSVSDSSTLILSTEIKEEQITQHQPKENEQKPTTEAQIALESPISKTKPQNFDVENKQEEKLENIENSDGSPVENLSSSEKDHILSTKNDKSSENGPRCEEKQMISQSNSEIYQFPQKGNEDLVSIDSFSSKEEEKQQIEAPTPVGPLPAVWNILEKTLGLKNAEILCSDTPKICQSDNNSEENVQKIQLIPSTTKKHDLSTLEIIEIISHPVDTLKEIEKFTQFIEIEKEDEIQPDDQKLYNGEASDSEESESQVETWSASESESEPEPKPKEKEKPKPKQLVLPEDFFDTLADKDLKIALQNEELGKSMPMELFEPLWGLETIRRARLHNQVLRKEFNEIILIEDTFYGPQGEENISQKKQDSERKRTSSSSFGCIIL